MLTFGDILIYVVTFFGLYTATYFLLTLLEAKPLKKGEAKTFKKVTICIPCYNEETTVEKTLSSLIDLDYPKNKLEIIVVDDGSKDDTYTIAKKFAKKHPDRLIRVFKKENGGKYTALNFALKKATGDFFGALDADSFVEKKALVRIMKYFEDQSIAAVTPSMKVYNPKNILQRIQAIEYLLGIFLRKIFAELGSIHVTPGPFSIYRMSFFKEHGLYKKAHHTEDIEVALRAQRANKIIENSVDAYVYTVAPKSFKVLYRQRLRWYVGFIKNIKDYKDLFSKKHGNLGLFVLPSSFLSVILVIMFMFYFFQSQALRYRTMFLNLQAVNFDVTQLEWFRFEWFFLNLTGPAILGIVALLVGIIMIVISKKVATEKKPIAFSYILFAGLYWMLFGFWWLISVIKVFILQKDIGWGHKSE